MFVVFPDAETLHLVVSSGIVPAETAVAPVSAGHDATGKTWVRWEPDHSVQEVLRRVGVSFASTSFAFSERVYSHWLQLFPVGRDLRPPVVNATMVILFELATDRAANFVNELLRLGHDRWEVMWHDHSAYVRTIGPPYYTLLAAFDRDTPDAPRAYRECGPRVWIEFAATHPFADRLDAPAGRCLLLRRDNMWVNVPDGPFHDVTAVTRVLEPMKHLANPALATESWNIPPTLVDAAATDPPMAWIVRQDAWQKVDAFVANLDARLWERFAFALTQFEGRPCVLLRLRPTQLSILDIQPPGEPFRHFARLPNLYVPIGQRIDPPLRRETVRRLFASDPAVISWLISGDNGITVETVVENAFRPLSAWVDSVLEHDHAALRTWIQATEFAFADLAIEEVASTKSSPSVKQSKAPKATKKPESQSAVAALPTIRANRRSAPIRSQPLAPAADAAELRDQLTEVEKQFLSIDGPLDQPERRALWPYMARLNAALRQPAEAALAWTHAVWDAPNPGEELYWGWVQAERALHGPVVSSADIDRLLTATPPAVADVRAVAAAMAWAGRNGRSPALIERLKEIQSYLLQYEHMLPPRATWLAWTAWARAAGGDTLALARARDRLLTRLLEKGLNAETDLPAFLRFAGRADGERQREVRGWLDDIRNKVRHWYREQTRVDLKRDPTGAYIDLLFAFGFARFGEATTARTIVRGAEQVFDAIHDDTRDPHLVLLQAFTWRIEQTQQGLPHAGPLPKEIREYISLIHQEATQLPRGPDRELRESSRYAVDRLIEQSTVLDPHEKVDPYRHTRRGEPEEILQAYGLADVVATSSLSRQMRDLLKRSQNKTARHYRVLAECLALAGRVDAEFVNDMLNQVIPAAERAEPINDHYSAGSMLKLLDRAIYFAGHLDRRDIVESVIGRLLQVVKADGSTWIMSAPSQAIGRTLRSMRRFGYTESTESVLESLSESILLGQTIDDPAVTRRSDWPKRLKTLLDVAAGWLHHGQPQRAEPILQAGWHYIKSANRPIRMDFMHEPYVQLLCNLILAYGFLPTHDARQRIGELFEDGRIDRLPNHTYTSGRYYSRFHLNVAEAVVLTLSGDEFTLGPAVRRWLEEDEYLIRRRVHRDTRLAVERG